MTRVLIVGASIAGPALAHWLHRYGDDVVVVEKAASIRSGGQAVDFKGAVQIGVLDRMGVLEDLRALDVRDPDVTIVNAKGRKVGTIPGAFGAGELNVPRGDIARVLWEHTRDEVDYRFGVGITSLSEHPGGVRVGFHDGSEEDFDLVIGADGMHSAVRRLAFGPESAYVTHLGAYYVLADLDIGAGQVSYSEPGLMATLGATKAPAFLAFASSPLPPARDDVAAQKHQVAAAMAHGGWRIPELLAQLPGTPDFYMDSISRAVVPHWSRGRVALVGDAAWGNALGGYGTGLALVGAYVLAGELARAEGEHTLAFAAYERDYRKYASVAEKVDASRLLVPRTRRGIRLRNAMFGVVGVAAPLLKILDRPAKGIRLQDYEAPASATSGTGHEH